ncbi:MAG: type II secretion system protein M [Pseudomonadota bacterium]
MDMNAIVAAPLRLWTERNPREQVLLAFAGLLLVVLVVWTFIVSPASQYRANAQASYEAAVESHRELVSGIGLHRRLAAASDGAVAGGDRSLGLLVAQSSVERSLSITRVQPDENGRITVWLDNVDSRALMDWLLALSAEEGVSVTRLTMDREGDGMVRAQLVIGRGGA